jgi:hypothetical protein
LNSSVLSQLRLTLAQSEIKPGSAKLLAVAEVEPQAVGDLDLYFARTRREYPPKTLAVNGKLNFENNHRGQFAIAVLRDGCCQKTPKLPLV